MRKTVVNKQQCGESETTALLFPFFNKKNVNCELMFAVYGCEAQFSVTIYFFYNVLQLCISNAMENML